jgi:hypothetical protein
LYREGGYGSQKDETRGENMLEGGKEGWRVAEEVDPTPMRMVEKARRASAIWKSIWIH